MNPQLFRQDLKEVTLIYYQQYCCCQFAGSINRISRKISMIQAHEEHHKGVGDPNGNNDHKNLNRVSSNRVAPTNERFHLESNKKNRDKRNSFACVRFAIYELNKNVSK